MPPLATSELDLANISLLTQWIQSFDPDRMSFADWQVANFDSTNAPGALAADDPDLDNRSNYLEYLLGTSPQLPNASADLSLDVSSSAVATISYLLSPNAIAQVQTSTNLSNWSLWNVPGNNGLPQVTNPQNISGSATNNAAFFRLLLNQR